MADPWAEFPDAPDTDDPWAAFPDAEPAPAARKPGKRTPRAPAVLPQHPGTAAVVDGDTIRLPGGTLRLWGVDAPELDQPGYGRNGVTVPVGQRSRAALEQYLSQGSPLIGQQQGVSYGRPVAPVTIDDADLVEQLLREGGGYGAPDFLADDPERRFDYLQAERLARLNGLGLHDYYVQPPAEYRENPDYVPARETVAQFFDTPTPIAGMSAAAEQRYLQLLDTATSPDEVVAFVESQGGFKLDPDAVASWIRARDAARAEGGRFDAAGHAVTYKSQPMPLTDLGDGALGAGARGFTQGFVAGGLDELGAFPDMLGLTPGRESVWNSDRRWADIWANNQQQNASILGYDEFAHPNVTTGGEVAGALTSGFVLPYGAGARTIPQLARVGAAYGGLEGFLGTDGNWVDRTKGALIGAPVGAAVNAVGGKALELAAPVVARGWRALRGNRGADAASGVSPGAVDEWAAYPDADEVPGTMAMDAEPMPSISGEARSPGDAAPLRPLPVDQPLSEAQMRALASNMQPGDVLPMPSNVVGGVEEAAAMDAGRFVPAKAPDERKELTRRTVRNFMGVEVPKVGPIDMVGFLRLRGGLADQGGELSAMGLTNASRRGLDFVGQEHRFGPMMRENGMALDDAALQAWEAGYFPELTERPTINQFLDALRETYEGRAGRRFLPEDAPELDAFYGRQAERFDLEQQQHDAGGPVYVDRSTPADDAAPFPPPEAYEEWPAETVRRAGNIDLDKLDSPQDIRRALVQVNNRVGFDAATRGRVTQAETERLAADLGMTADDLLSRRKGQALNAEEALAARQILAKSGNELVNIARRIQRIEDPGDELLAAFQRALVRHAAIQEQVAGATAEAGRALGQFKMLASSRAVPGEVLASMRDMGGGTRRIKQAADTILDAVEGPPGRFNTVARKAVDPRFSDKLAELYINQLLSGPQTHVVNAVGNTMTAIAQIPENAVAAAIGGSRRLFARREIDRVMGGEIGTRLFAMLQGTREGFDFAARALRTGETSDTFSKIAGHDMRAISGVKGEVARIPVRLLNTADEFFKGVARRAEINALAYRQAHKEGLTGEALERRIADLSANPPEDIEHQALDFARYMTFQRPLTGVGQDVSRMVRGHPLLRPVVTFVRTPVNLLKWAVERSPGAPLLKEWRKDFGAGGARRDMAIARATLGSGVASMMYLAALEGRITGSAPGDPAKNRFMRSDGWQPHSVRIGDQWISYSRLDPFALQASVAADLATRADGMSDKQLENYGALLVASIMSAMADKTWLSGVTDASSALSDPERYGPAYLRRLGASFLIPNLFAQTARTVDPVQRERDTFGDELQSRVPGLSSGLPAARDIWGNAIETENKLGPDLLNPFRQSAMRSDPVSTEMLAIGARFGPPSKQYTADGKRVDWTPEQYDRLTELTGRAAYSGMMELMADPAWAEMDRAAKLKAATKVFTDARANARGAVLDGSAPGGGGEWDGFPDAGDGDPWSAFPDAAQRDVTGELEAAIPGIRFTSGFRTAEYQADMRRRGYNPASNSAHLDGSALDMLPPPGRSLSWLRQQVEKAEPGANLSIHDGHLHAVFPDWQGAPVLGGARSAGVRNPYAGMPPPPAGITVDAR